MVRRDRLLLLVGVAAAAAAVALAVHLGKGTVDSAGGPGATAAPAPSAPILRKGLPALALPPGLPADAAAALRDAHAALASGTREEAARALASLAVPAPAGPVAPRAAAALEALAPALEWLIVETDSGLSGAAMEAAAGLARRGGDEGRRALERSGLVDTAFAPQVRTGPPDLRREAALLLGFVATDRAVGWLVVVLRRAAETEVREAAAAALAEAYRVNGRLPHEALQALKEVLDSPATPAPVRRTCLGALRESFEQAAAYGVVEGAVAALEDADPGTRMAAADLFFAHPVAAAGKALVRRAAEEKDPRILAAVAGALGAMRPVPEGAAAALQARLPGLEDPAAAEAVRRALRTLPPPR